MSDRRCNLLTLLQPLSKFITNLFVLFTEVDGIL